ncbi:MAG: YesL family protein [Agathobacter sp.]|nr:YesL family protein [Agathobacter sp.]
MLFNPENSFFSFIGTIGNFIMLNLLFVFCSIPLVTIGASYTALYYTMFKITEDDTLQITKDFFHSFKENLKQSTIVHLILSVVGAFLIFDLAGVLQLFSQSIAMKVLFCLFFCLALIYCFITTYVYPILAKFSNNTKNTFKNAALLSIANLPITVVMTTINIIPLILFFVLPQLFMSIIPFYLFIGFSLTAFINCKLMSKIFKKLPTA